MMTETEILEIEGLLVPLGNSVCLACAGHLRALLDERKRLLEKNRILVEALEELKNKHLQEYMTPGRKFTAFSVCEKALMEAEKYA